MYPNEQFTFHKKMYIALCNILRYIPFLFLFFFFSEHKKSLIDSQKLSRSCESLEAEFKHHRSKRKSPRVLVRTFLSFSMCCYAEPSELPFEDFHLHPYSFDVFPIFLQHRPSCLSLVPRLLRALVWCEKQRATVEGKKDKPV